MDEDAKAYLKHHKIHQVLETLVSSVVKDKPNDPLAFILDRLTQIQRETEMAPEIHPVRQDSMKVTNTSKNTHDHLPAPLDSLSPHASAEVNASGTFSQTTSLTPKMHGNENMDLSTAEGLDFLREKFKARAKEDGGETVLTKEDFSAVLESYLGYTEGQPRSEALSQLYTIFDTFDNDRSGSVDVDEFTQGMRILFAGSEDERLEFAFTGLDYDHDGDVSREEFINYFKSYFSAKCAVEGRKLEAHRWTAIETHLGRVFRGTDADNSGAIDMNEFRKGVKSDPDHPFTLIWHSFTRATSPSQGRAMRRSSGMPMGGGL